MKLDELSDEAQEILDRPFTLEDLAECERYLNRFECTTTALYLIAAHLATEGDEARAELIAPAVAAMATHEAKER